MSERCPWAIRFGVVLVTRCFLDAGHGGVHRGRGLRDSPQILMWVAGDAREFESHRPDAWAWEVVNHRARR